MNDDVGSGANYIIMSSKKDPTLESVGMFGSSATLSLTLVLLGKVELAKCCCAGFTISI